MFALIGPFIERHRWRVIAVALLLLALGVVGLIDGGRLTAATIEGLESDRASSLVDRITGRAEASSLAVVIRSTSEPPLGLFDPAFVAERDRVLAKVREVPGVQEVVIANDAPAFLAERMRNKAAHAEAVFITLDEDPQRGLAAYPKVRAALDSDVLSIEATGNLAFVADLATVLEHDLLRAELISMPLALLVLLWVFRTAVAAALPVLVGGLSVVCGIALVMLLSHAFPIAQYTINVCSLIGFGVAIDYSLFLVSRYREELAAGKNYSEALQIAVATAGRAVAFSGLAVGVGLAGLLFFEGSYLSVMGMGGSLVVALAVLFALTLLPAVLAVLGPRIHLGRIGPKTRLALGPEQLHQGAWHQLAQRVMRAPMLFLLPTLLLLLGIAAPAKRLHLAATDVTVLPSHTDARRGVDTLQTLFPELAADRLAVVVSFPDAPVLTEARVGALFDKVEQMRKIPGILRIESIIPDPKALQPEGSDGEDDEFAAPPLGRADVIELLTQSNEMTAGVLEEGKRMTVRDHLTALYAVFEPDAPRELREAAVHALRSDRQVGDGTLEVGGKVAHDVDSTAFMLSRAPQAALFVISVTCLVVFWLLRSLLLPIKAVLMNMLSIAATFGVLVFVFQDGHLLVSEGRPLEPTLPVLLFCVSFGLSMDYEVLMLARMREAYERHGDNTLAVAEGLEASAGLVTSAAAIMVAVFSAFALASVVVLQATGVGLAAAVALDATLVRALLVPATMRLLGKWNWWAPKALRGGPFVPH